MAVAARPGASDARVPCPLCGGLIHPIAGKCKHCKADLTTYHAARPAASAPLPALAAVDNGRSNGASGPAAVAPTRGPAPAGAASPVGPNGMRIAAVHGAAQPVLPPRPASSGAPAPSGWRSWPVVAIILAILAIVAALVLMAWPAGRERGNGKQTLQPPPAPERMQTEPDLQQPPVKPPAAPRSAQPGAGPATRAPDHAAPDDPGGPPSTGPGTGRADPSDPSAPDDNAQPQGGQGFGLVPHNLNSTMTLAMLSRLCVKLAQCDSDDDMAKSMCEALASAPTPPPPNCPAASRCLAHIDGMSCSGQGPLFAQLNQLVLQLQDCVDADRC